MRPYQGVAAAVSLLLLFTSTLAAQEDLSGYFEVSPAALPDTLSESHAGGAFRLTVVRNADSEEARRLLRQAESLFPSRESIEAEVADVLRSRSGPGWAARMREVASITGPRWWWDTFDRILTPYALTGPAVAYYLDRLRELAAGPNPFVESSGTARHSGEVTYRAGVQCDADSGLCVVRMRLDWRYDCGSLCAIWFTEERSVTFDSAGRVVSVEGDGRPLYGVS